jgi:hypothetical protein
MDIHAGVSPVDSLEKKLIRGGARWVADLSEFFRDYRVEDATFDLYAKGKTRTSGFILSRFVAWTVLPNYLVGFFAEDVTGDLLTVDRIRKRIDTVGRLSEKENYHWSWLIFFSDREIPASVFSFVTRYDKKEVGLGVASSSSGQVVVSNNQVGKSIRGQLGLRKVMGVAKTRNA